ncbi:MAG: hypothetical protein ACR2L2_05465 [Acidobacteriota bacterium]
MMLALFFVALMAGSPDCEALQARVLEKGSWPVKLETRGRPAAFKREQVGAVLDTLGKEVAASLRDSSKLACNWTFSQLFGVTRPDRYLVLTDAVLRWVPEAALEGVEVFDRNGEKLGRFASRSRYERTGGGGLTGRYSLNFFQYLDPSGKYQSSGHDLTQDRFLVKWEHIKDRKAIDSNDLLDRIPSRP